MKRFISPAGAILVLALVDVRHAEPVHLLGAGIFGCERPGTGQR